MSREEARELLDSVKSDERHAQGAPLAQREDDRAPKKPGQGLVMTGRMLKVRRMLKAGVRSGLLCLTTLAAWAAAPPVSATLQPQQISVGESAQLTITTSGNGMDAVTLPKVAGLEFRVVGQSRRVEVINGATLSTTSVIVRVVPQSAGIFSIPGITAQPLLLRVNPDNGTGSSRTAVPICRGVRRWLPAGPPPTA